MAAVKLLVINPNSSVSVTNGLENTLVAPPATQLAFYTAPRAAPTSIMDLKEGILSAAACFEDIKSNGYLDTHDGFLVCCFSDHPLTHMLREVTDKPVMNILEAAVSHSLFLGHRFGIITTGTGYKYIYHADVRNFLGATSDRFAGLVTTGLNVLELRNGDPQHVEVKIKAAAVKIVQQGADVVILGCAGMAGMESLVKGGASEAGLGPVRVVDGAKAGVQFLSGLARLE